MTKNFLAIYIAEILLCICQEGEKNKKPNNETEKKKNTKTTMTKKKNN